MTLTNGIFDVMRGRIAEGMRRGDAAEDSPL
jgi:hypothetical protein